MTSQSKKSETNWAANSFCQQTCPFKEFNFWKRKAEANLLLGQNIKQETG